MMGIHARAGLKYPLTANNDGLAQNTSKNNQQKVDSLSFGKRPI